MRIAFFGSGHFGLPTLTALHAQHEVLAVVSQPDKPAGRKRVLTATPVAAWAERAGLPVWKSADVNAPAFVARVAALELEASVVIAFGQKLCPELIAAMGKLAVNLHGSLLPGYRGAAPIQRAIINGETTAGVSVIALAQRMDAGEVYATASLPINPQETSGELHDRLAELGPAVIAGVLDDLQRGALTPHPQDHGQATRAPKLTKSDGTVSFDQPAAVVRAQINGLNPWPGCRVAWRPGAALGGSDGSGGGGAARPLMIRRVVEVVGDSSEASGVQGSAGASGAALPGVAPGTVLDGLGVACAGGAIRLLELQAPGTSVMDAATFARGRSLRAGDVLEPWDFSG